MYRRENSVEGVAFETFSIEDEVFGEKVVIDLKENGRNIDVTDENKQEWVAYVQVVDGCRCEAMD